jgi:uncharacterized protein (TIGR01777 family)
VKIVIPGGSGQVGCILSRHFHAAGHEVVVLSRAPQSSPGRTVLWNAQTPGGWTAEFEGADVCINLAGRSVNCRYNEKNRREILDSRVQTTKLVGEVIAAARTPPALWINASTATIYRHALDRPMDEASGELGGNEPGAPEKWNFSIAVAKAWESAFFNSMTRLTRKIAIRSAITFSPDGGGAFDVFSSLVRHGLGGAQGRGNQYVSWIHDADFARAIDFLIAREDLDGAVNLASPNPVPNREFMRILRSAWGMSFGLPAPRWALEIGAIFMRTETELVLKSRRVVPGRLLASGFEFQFPEWAAAARDLVSRMRAR